MPHPHRHRWWSGRSRDAYRGRLLKTRIEAELHRPGTADRGPAEEGSLQQVFVVEQNRDAQLRTLLVAELGMDPAKLIAVLHYDGTPITARFIVKEISQVAGSLNVMPISMQTAHAKKSAQGGAAE